ncbi:MAG: alpha-mannosidase, partial [Candidatus Eremiobacteraeota bacterium]|nr:alpha-mannosidase [Candidatus Eremiobacteraeota bacterium]
MRVALTESARGESTVVLTARLPASPSALVVAYRTSTGALARVDGRVAGAFDREHHELVLAPSEAERTLTLEVELQALPTNGLPAGPGLQWNRLVAQSKERPSNALSLSSRAKASGGSGDFPRAEPSGHDNVPLWGHAHLDVAWLWTYDDTRRKAMRTFANAVALLDEDPSYVFVQSQPQLYAFVEEADAEFYERVREHVKLGRFDPDVAAMWVEPDCNIPSGESLLRQMQAAHRFCERAFGIEPSIAWLPDTFGFPRTLPALLAHAGIGCFGTTKLQWNDTTRFPYAQFRWRGPDGAEVLSAQIERMEGDCDARRIGIAKERNEPLIVGYGDGGGGPTAEQLDKARGKGHWERASAFFERMRDARERLPVHDDELYLEYHRGVYTTHHEIKAHNAALERSLAAAEERAAWCVAVRVPPDGLTSVRQALRAAWEIVLRNQFHDVLPGTSIAEVYVDAREEYRRAHELVEQADTALRAMLPRGRAVRAPEPRAPVLRDGAYEFDNGEIRATVLPSGTIVELEGDGYRNAVAQANLLALYRDRPKKWEAWNLDDGYQRTQRAARPGRATITADGALEVPFVAGTSAATMRVALHRGEPFLRVDLAVDWRERQRILRLENWLSVEVDEVTYGAPHGSVTRSARDDTPARRARYEVPGQRFAAVHAASGASLALLALDTYGWSARILKRGGLALGHSLLRSTTWPDPRADEGEHQLSWAYAPLAGRSVGAIERLWERFASEPPVRLFESSDAAVLVVACKPAENGEGVILR